MKSLLVTALLVLFTMGRVHSSSTAAVDQQQKQPQPPRPELGTTRSSTRSKIEGKDGSGAPMEPPFPTPTEITSRLEKLLSKQIAANGDMVEFRPGHTKAKKPVTYKNYIYAIYDAKKTKGQGFLSNAKASAEHSGHGHVNPTPDDNRFANWIVDTAFLRALPDSTKFTYDQWRKLMTWWRDEGGWWYLFKLGLLDGSRKAWRA